MNRLQLAWKFLTTREVDLTAANSLFGTIGGQMLPISTSKQFIPIDGQGGIMMLDGTDESRQARWLGLDNKIMQYHAYRYCSPLAAVIDRLAEASSNGIIGFYKEDDTPFINYKKSEKHNRIMNLMRKPNPLQTFGEYDLEQIKYCKIFGYCPVFAAGPVGMDKSYTKYLFNINPYFATPIPNEDYNPYADPDSVNANPILRWDCNLFGYELSIPASAILLIKDSDIGANNIGAMGLPISKVAGLDFWVSNICAAMEADNVLLRKKGPLGIFSYDPRPDMAGWTPMSLDMKKELQDDLRQYGYTLSQLQHVVSKTPMKWISTSYNVEELGTKNTVRQGIDGICDRMGFPAELMSGKNATYENRNSAGKWLYESNVIPFSFRRMERYQQFFDIEGLWLNYDHLPILQEDIVKAGEARKAKSESLNLDWMAGLISYNEYRKGLDLPEVPGKEAYYYADYIKDNPQVLPKPAKVKPIKKAKDAKAA